jgi:hypothetical protein
VPVPHSRPSPFTRDDPRYWESWRPADHNPAGLFREGPQEAVPPTSRLSKSPETSPYDAPPPAVAMAQWKILRKRRLTLLERREAFVQLFVRGADGRPFVRRGAA